MKFDLIQCHACELKCVKSFPVQNNTKIDERIKEYNQQYCVTFKAGQNIKLKTSVFAQGLDVKPNDLCFCGSGKKFKKCHIGII